MQETYHPYLVSVFNSKLTCDGGVLVSNVKGVEIVID